MNQKRSRRRSSSQNRENDAAVKLKDKAKSLELLLSEQASIRGSNTTQSNPLHQFLGYFWQDSPWSNFNRGLFWGGLVGLTAVSSAMGGVALTKIDAVEQQISARLQQTSATSSNYPVLTESLQILLVEVEPDKNALTGFSKTTVGRVKTILLLEVEPEANFARAIFVPLDSNTNIPGVGRGTIQDAYQTGGMELLSEAANHLPYDITSERYLRTTPEVFRQLIKSGKISLDRCEPRIENCSDKLERIARQETAFKTIRQRLNIPSYLANFSSKIAQLESQLDTNLDLAEIMSVASFVRELEPDRIGVELLPGYTPGSPRRSKDPARSVVELPKSKIAADPNASLQNPFKNNSVAVQNTTENPELGRRVVAYLREQNFADVYLIEREPLKLQQSKIVTNYSQVETANYLKSTLGFGTLEPESEQQQLVLQLGEDALYLTEENDSY